MLAAMVASCFLHFCMLAAEVSLVSKASAQALPLSADCSNFPACAGLEGNCCPTPEGFQLLCCSATGTDDVSVGGATLSQPQVGQFVGSAVASSGLAGPAMNERMSNAKWSAKMPSVFHQSSSVPVDTCVLGGDCSIDTCDLAGGCPLQPVPVQEPWGVSSVDVCELGGVCLMQPSAAQLPCPGPCPEPCPLECTEPSAAAEPIAETPLQPLRAHVAPRAFREGDCVVAREDIGYGDDGDHAVTVAKASVGAVVSTEPLGIMWRGHDKLANAQAKPEQVSFPEPREGKILAVQRGVSPVKVLCLAASRAEGIAEHFAASVKPLPCEKDSENQTFHMLPCGTGRIRFAGNMCMELVHPELTLLKPCSSGAIDGQTFQLQVESKRFQAGVGGYVGCYDVGGPSGEDLRLAPCNETTTEFSFLSSAGH